MRSSVHGRDGGTGAGRCSLARGMKTLSVLLMLALLVMPSGISAQPTDLSGNWNATFTRTAPDGRTQSITFTFHFVQEGKTLTGTIGPEPSRQWPVEKGVVEADVVRFQAQQPDGPLRTFALTLIKGRLQGRQVLEYQGQTAEVTVDAERAK
jgi:hypothetical protein